MQTTDAHVLTHIFSPHRPVRVDVMFVYSHFHPTSSTSTSPNAELDARVMYRIHDYATSPETPLEDGDDDDDGIPWGVLCEVKIASKEKDDEEDEDLDAGKPGICLLCSAHTNNLQKWTNLLIMKTTTITRMTNPQPNDHPSSITV